MSRLVFSNVGNPPIKSTVKLSSVDVYACQDKLATVLCASLLIESISEFVTALPIEANAIIMPIIIQPTTAFLLVFSP